MGTNHSAYENKLLCLHQIYTDLQITTFTLCKTKTAGKQKHSAGNGKEKTPGPPPHDPLHVGTKRLSMRSIIINANGNSAL